MRTATLAIVAGLVAALCGCGTVDLGTYEGVRDLKLDEDFYYCSVQPLVITAKKCASGDPSAGDASGGCHASTTALRLEQIDTPVSCVGGHPSGQPSPGERANYAAASLRVNRDVESSPLLVRPTQTGGATHPRKIFESDSPEATIIRKWAAGAR